MASLPQQHPELGMHLCDAALTPIISSSRTRKQLKSLTSLADVSLKSHSAAMLFGLGEPRRIVVEHQAALNDDTTDGTTDDTDSTMTDITTTVTTATDNTAVPASLSPKSTGPIAIHTYLHPVGMAPTIDTTSSPASNFSPTSGLPPPLLLGIVVAEDAAHGAKANRARARLDRVGKEFQREYARGGWDIGGNGGQVHVHNGGWEHGFGFGGNADGGAMFGRPGGARMGFGMGPGMSPPVSRPEDGGEPEDPPRRWSRARRKYDDYSDSDDS